MARKQPVSVVCQICGQQKKPAEVVPGELVRESIVRLILKSYPDWSPNGYICNKDLNAFRAEYVREALELDKGEVSELEEQVMNSLKDEDILSTNVNADFDQQLTFGERVSDRLARYAGSWRFIVGFFVVMVLWVVLNTVLLVVRPFDPYPFILLNLLLSCLAAIQAPVILMSQNRQETRDRLRSDNDYVVNLKAELEIRHLHEKLDHLLVNQWRRLLEIQEVQTELMEQLIGKQR